MGTRERTPARERAAERGLLGRDEKGRGGARAFRTHRLPVALLEDLAGRLAGQDAGAAERGGLQGERGRVKALPRSRAGNGTEGRRALTVFSLSLSDRFFRGDRPFRRDTLGWSWRVASGTREDSMMMVAAERAALTGGRVEFPRRPFIFPSNLAPESPADHSQPAPRTPAPASALLLVIGPAGAAPPIVVAAAGGKDPPFGLAPAEPGKRRESAEAPPPAAPRHRGLGAELSAGLEGPPGPAVGTGRSTDEPWS